MKRWLVILSMVLLALSLACSAIPGGKPEPTEEGPAAVTVVVEQEPEDDDVGTAPEDEDDAGDAEDAGQDDADQDAGQNDDDETGQDDGDQDAPENGDAFTLDPNALNELQSYRNEIVMAFESENGESGEVYIKMDVTNDPPAQRVLMSFEGEMPILEEDAQEMAGFEFEAVEIGDTQWVRLGEMWMQFDATGDDAMDMDSLDDVGELIEMEDLEQLAEENALTYEGKETVNGVQTRHYHLEYQASLFERLGWKESEEIEDGDLDIWIADESDLPSFAVRMVLTLEGEIEGQPGSLTVTQEVTDINAPFTIEPPEDADSVNQMPEDVPAYPGAEEENVFGGFITFSTDDDVETVAEFYREELPTNGWEQVESSEFGTVMETWEKADQELSLIITPNEDEGKTSVVITITEKE